MLIGKDTKKAGADLISKAGADLVSKANPRQQFKSKPALICVYSIFIGKMTIGIPNLKNLF